jgi:hypothetical protein
VLQDEAATRLKGSAPLRPRGEPGTATATLSKCKSKACKLTFASLLNQQRCQMSHLPSARTTTAKVRRHAHLMTCSQEPLATLRRLVGSSMYLQLPSCLPTNQVQPPFPLP